MLKIISVALLLFSINTFAAGKEHKSFVKCQFKNLVRTIRVSGDDNGCVAIYTKQGKDQVIGTGTAAGNCYGFIDNIRNNLEGANWSCRQFKDFTVVSD